MPRLGSSVRRVALVIMLVMGWTVVEPVTAPQVASAAQDCATVAGNLAQNCSFETPTATPTNTSAATTTSTATKQPPSIVTAPSTGAKRPTSTARLPRTATLTPSGGGCGERVRTTNIGPQTHPCVPQPILPHPIIRISPTTLKSGNLLTLEVETVSDVHIVASICCVSGLQKGSVKSDTGYMWMGGAAVGRKGGYTWRIGRLAVVEDTKMHIHVTITREGWRATTAEKDFTISFNNQNGLLLNPFQSTAALYNPSPGMGYILPQCGPFSHVGQILYAPLDEEGRATGACAELARPLGGGTHVDPDLRRSGCYPNDLRTTCDTAHLIADFLGGTGKKRENLTYTTSQANKSGMKKWELQVRTFLKEKRIVIFNVTPYYDSKKRIPIYIDMYAEQVYDHPQNVMINGVLMTVDGCRLFLKRVYNTPEVTSQDLPADSRTYWCPGLPRAPFK